MNKKNLFPSPFILIIPFSFFFILPFSYTLAQNLTPEEQRELLNKVKRLESKLDRIESNKQDSYKSQTSSQDTNDTNTQPKTQSRLKTTNFENSTVDSGSSAGSSTGSSRGKREEISEEQRRELMDNIEKLKKTNEENNKALEKLMDEP